MDPEPDPDPLHSDMTKLDDALSLEEKYRPFLQLPYDSKEKKEVTIGIREGSAHVLRCLKIWYDLPSDVFFLSINLVDRFITKMKVKSKHMACISVGSFQLACKIVSTDPIPHLQDIITISQAKCSVPEVVRMQDLVSSKLAVSPSLPKPITPFTFLSIFHSFLTAADTQQFYSRIVSEFELTLLLEVVMCDVACSNFKPSEIALALICAAFDTKVARLKNSPPPNKAISSLLTVVGQIHQTAKLSERGFLDCHSTVMGVVGRYYAQLQVPHRQLLVWKVSQRTLRHLRPTGRLVTTLQTIHEHGQLQIQPRTTVSTEEGIHQNCPSHHR